MNASDQTTLVTGGTGYLGSNLTASFLEKGIPVACLVRPGSEHKAPAGATILTNGGSVEALAASFRKLRVKTVLHLATNFVAEHDPAQIPVLIESNVTFGVKVAEAAALSGATRFLNIGTFWQNYEGRGYSPASLYAATKQAFETMLQYYVEARGMAAVTLKFAAVYGPDDPRAKIVGLLIDSLRSGKPLALSPGEQLLDLIQVEDAVRAIFSGVEILNKLAPGEYRSYSVTSGQPITLKGLVDVLAELTGKKAAVQWGAKPYRKREFFSDWVCDERIPNWRPQILLKEGLSRMVKGI